MMALSSNMSIKSAGRNLWLSLFWGFALILFWPPLSTLVRLSFHDEKYSHIVVIPLISMCLVYLERKKIFLGSRYCPATGVPLLLLGAILYGIALKQSSLFNENDSLSLLVFAIVAVCMAGFMLCYGPQSFRAAAFPLFFLLLMIPIPTILLQKVVLALQKGSAEMTYVLFKLLSVPVSWHGFKFSLPGVEI
jgi:exosortase